MHEHLPDRPTKILRSAELLVLANAVSVAGDVLFAFLWNGRLVLNAPTTALTLLGLASVIGAGSGLILGRRIARTRNQAKIVARGASIRAGAVACAAISTFLGTGLLLPFAVIAQIVDIAVGVLTAGAISTLISQRVSRERFTQMTALSQSASRTAVLVAWVLGGVLLARLRATGLLVVDVLSFLPVAMLLYSWSGDEEAKNLTLVRTTSRPSGERSAMPRTHLLLSILTFALIYVFGSLVSRTTPLLWRDLFSHHQDIVGSLQITTGALFAVFAGGTLLGSSILSTTPGSRSLGQRITTVNGVVVVAVLLGVNLSILPVASSSPVLFFALLACAGIISGFLYPAFSGFVRHTYQDTDLKIAFYYMGLVGRFAEPLGSGLAGGLLVIARIRALYVFSGVGMAVASIVFLTVASQIQGKPLRDGSLPVR
jgi:hypothetical protein